MKTTITRLAAGAVLTLGVLAPAGAASAAPALTDGAVAPAGVTDCQTYLRKQGYTVGPKVTKACRQGSTGTGAGNAACRDGLRAIGVKRQHADAACHLATRP
ncbi:hypothetical protein [Amycolatopsis suaedae]|uniref:Secreted protein n=1 Tax=Amycolatopsis suaedae TaxID=2510978 RepID=A0A4Q7J1H0_9PSEU|nr:hypothetical protein [Amycolatopsis suaedae]RZQ61241.1 hypothetical protein EWH70_25580 [Amycolatopsis suaedae]